MFAHSSSGRRRMLVSTLPYNVSDAEYHPYVPSYLNASSLLRRHGCRRLHSSNIVVLSSCSTMGAAGRPDACRGTAGGVRRTRHSSVYLTAVDLFAAADRALRGRLYLTSSLIKCVSSLPTKPLHGVSWALCWRSCHGHYESNGSDPSRVRTAARRRQRHSCRAYHCYWLWTSLLCCIAAFLVLSGHFPGRTDNATSTHCSQMRVFPLVAQCGLIFATADTSVPYNSSTSGSDLWRSRELPPTQSSARTPPSQARMSERRVSTGQVDRSRRSSGDASSAATTWNTAAVASSHNAVVHTTGHEEMSDLKLSSRTQEEAVDSDSHTRGRGPAEETSQMPVNDSGSAADGTTGAAGSRELTGGREGGSALRRPSPAPEACAPEVSASGSVTLSCGTYEQPTGDGPHTQVPGAQKSHQEPAADGRPPNGRPQGLVKNREQRRRTQHEVFAQQKQMRAGGNGQQHRREASLDLPGGRLLQQEETTSMPATNGKQTHGAGGLELRERGFQEKNEPTGYRSEKLSRSLQDNWDQRQEAGGDHEHGATTVKAVRALQNGSISWTIPVSQTQPRPRSEAVGKPPSPYLEEKRLPPEELKAAQNIFMADLTAHLSRLWRKHWLQALESAQLQPYKVRLSALRVIIEQLDVAVNSVIFSRPRNVSVGLGKWLHKVREVFIFVFSTRMRLGVASANLRPVGPLASTAHDIPEESAEVVEVVTSASQRVLLLAPPNRKENARCIVNGHQEAWKQIQASLFPPSVEAKFVETRASLAKLFDLFGENVSSFGENRQEVSTTESKERHTKTNSDPATYSNTGIATSSHPRNSGSTNSSTDNGTKSINRVSSGVQSKSTQGRGSGSARSSGHVLGSSHGRNSPENANSVLDFEPDTGKVWGTQPAGDARSAAPAGFSLSGEGERSARKRSASMDISGSDLPRDVAVQFPITPELTPTTVETEKSPPSIKNILSTASDNKGDSSAYGERFSLDPHAPAPQKPTKDYEGRDGKEKSRSSRTSSDRVDIDIQREGDNRLAKASEGSHRPAGRDTDINLDVSEVAEKARTEGVSSVVGRPKNDSITKTSERASVVGVYEKTLDSDAPGALLTDNPLDSYDTFSSGVRESGSSTAAVVPASEKRLHEGANVPQGAQTIASESTGADGHTDIIKVRRDDWEAEPGSVQAIEEANATSENDAHGSKTWSSDTFVNTLQEGNATVTGSTVAGGRAVPLYLTSESTDLPDSHVNSSGHVHSGSENVQESTRDLTGGRPVESGNGGNSGIKHISSSSSKSSDGKKMNGLQNAAEPGRGESSKHFSAESRHATSDFGTTSPSSRPLSEQKEGGTISSSTYTLERQSPNTDGEAATSRSIRSSDSTGNFENLYSKDSTSSNLISRETDCTGRSGITTNDATNNCSNNSRTEGTNSGNNNCSANNSDSATDESTAGGRGPNRNDGGVRDSVSTTEGHSNVQQYGDSRRTSRSDWSVKEVSRRGSPETRNEDIQNESSFRITTMGGGTPQVIDSATETNSTGLGVTIDRRDRTTEELTKSSGDGDSDSGSRETSSTGASQSKSREDMHEVTNQSSDSTPNHVGTKGTEVTAKPSTSGEESHDGENKNGPSRRSSSVSAGGCMNNSSCNTVKTDRRVNAVYCIADDSEEGGSSYKRGRGDVSDGLASRARADSVNGPSISVPAERFSGGLVLEKEILASNRATEGLVHPQQNKEQQPYRPLRMPTSILPSQRASSLHDSEPVRMEHQGELYQQSKGGTESAARLREGYEETSRAPGSEKSDNESVSSGQWQTQPRKLPQNLVLPKERLSKDTTGLQQQVVSDDPLQQMRPDTLQQRQDMQQPQQTLTPSATEWQGRINMGIVSPQHKAGGGDRGCPSDQHSEEIMSGQKRSVGTIEQEAGRLVVGHVRQRQQTPLSEKQLHLDAHQPSANSTPGQAKNLPGERRQQQEPLPAHMVKQQQLWGPPLEQRGVAQQTVERETRPFPQRQQDVLKLQETVQTSSGGRQQFDGKKKVQWPLAEETSTHARSQQEPQTILYPKDRKSAVSEEYSRASKRSVSSRRDAQQPSTRATAGEAHSQAARASSSADGETDAASERLQQNSKKREGVLARVSFPTQSPRGEREGAAWQEVVPKEDETGNKLRGDYKLEQQVTTGGASQGAGSEQLLSANGRQQERLQQPNQSTRSSADPTVGAGQSNRKEASRAEHAGAQARGSRATDAGVANEELPPRGTTRVDGNLIKRDTTQEHAKLSTIKKVVEQQNARVWKQERAQPRREVGTRTTRQTQETTEPWRTQEHLRRRHALRQRESQHRRSRKEATQHSYLQHRETRWRESRQQIAQQQLMHLQATLHPAALNQRVTQPGRISRRSATTAHDSTTPRHEGRGQINQVLRSPAWYRKSQRLQHYEEGSIRKEDSSVHMRTNQSHRVPQQKQAGRGQPLEPRRTSRHQQQTQVTSERQQTRKVISEPERTREITPELNQRWQKTVLPFPPRDPPYRPVERLKENQLQYHLQKRI